MSAAVNLENVIVEIFHAKAETRDAHFANRPQLVVRKRARFDFEGNLLGLVPRQQRLHAAGQMFELIDRKKRRRSAAEIDEVWFSPANEGLASVQAQFLQR